MHLGRLATLVGPGALASAEVVPWGLHRAHGLQCLVQLEACARKVSTRPGTRESGAAVCFPKGL